MSRNPAPRRASSRPWPVLLLPLALLALGGRAEPPPQDSDDRPEPAAMVTDRPDFTESASTIARGMYQIEVGYTAAGLGVDRQHVLGETLLRIGTGSDVELRIGLGSLVVHPSASGNESGLDDASLGAKIRLAHASRQNGVFRPEVALIVATSVPTGSGPAGRSGVVPLAVVAAAWDLRGPWQLGANIGAEYDVQDGDRFVAPRASVSLARSINDRWGAFVESYALLPGGNRRDTLVLDGGITYALSSDVQIDARVGSDVAGLNEGSFFGLGLSTRR